MSESNDVVFSFDRLHTERITLTTNNILKEWLYSTTEKIETAKNKTGVLNEGVTSRIEEIENEIEQFVILTVIRK